jgi:hypothetical protein
MNTHRQVLAWGMPRDVLARVATQTQRRGDQWASMGQLPLVTGWSVVGEGNARNSGKSVVSEGNKLSPGKSVVGEGNERSNGESVVGKCDAQRSGKVSRTEIVVEQSREN